MVTSDPHAPSPTQELSEALAGADAVVIATNHSEFEGPQALDEIVRHAGGAKVTEGLEALPEGVFWQPTNG